MYVCLIKGKDFMSAKADPVAVAGNAPDAVQHCNADHAPAVLLMAQKLTGLGDHVSEATMLSVDRYGFDVLCVTPDGKRRSRVAFSTPLDDGSSESLREAMVAETKRARAMI